MASIGSLSGSTSSAVYGSNKRITGLASGLDTESMIEGMTLATKTKIAKQKQDKQWLQWMMDDYRTLTSKMLGFQDKFTSYVNKDSNLLSPSFYDKSLITTIGDNSKYLDISGTSPNIENLIISAVQQMAKNETVVSKDSVSDQTMSSDAIKDSVVNSTLNGASLTIKYGSQDYTIKLPEDAHKNITNVSSLKDALNNAMKEITVGKDKKLSDVVEFGLDGNKLTLKYDDKNNTGNTLILSAGTTDLLGVMGMNAGTMIEAGSPLTGSKEVTASAIESMTKEKSLADALMGAGKSITFSYNGNSVQIKMPDKDAKVTINGKEVNVFEKKGSGDDATYTVNKEALTQYLQNKMDDAFGTGRVTVNFDKKTSQMSFKTKEGTDVLRVTGGHGDVLQGLGLKSGESNRLNLSSSLKDAGLKGFDKMSDEELKKLMQEGIVIKRGDREIVINKTTSGKAFDENTTLAEIINAVNENSEAKMTISYNETADKFTITSKDPGETGTISIGKTGGKEENIGTKIFGEIDSNNTGAAGNDKYNISQGQDAIIWVDYDGKGGADPIQIKGSSNSFNLDGLNVTVKNTFGVKKDAIDKDGIQANELDPDASVSFTAKVDSEKVTKAMKEMIEAFNEIIKFSNDKVGEKRERDYKPLTDEQRKEMTEDQIKAWEEKAKKGTLFNSNELRSFTNSIRFIFSGSAEKMKELSDMGITISSNYEDHGKISFDEQKFKSALEENNEKVKELFTAQKTYVYDDKGNQVFDANGKPKMTEGGIMTQIKNTFDMYAKTSGAKKGVFVEKAGATESSASIMKNELQNQVNKIDKTVKELERKMKAETERYYRQFTSMEMFISQMNSQSMWMAQQFMGQ